MPSNKMSKQSDSLWLFKTFVSFFISCMFVFTPLWIKCTGCQNTFYVSMKKIFFKFRKIHKLSKNEVKYNSGSECLNFPTMECFNVARISVQTMNKTYTVFKIKWTCLKLSQVGNSHFSHKCWALIWFTYTWKTILWAINMAEYFHQCCDKCILIVCILSLLFFIQSSWFLVSFEKCQNFVDCNFFDLKTNVIWCGIAMHMIYIVRFWSCL